MIKYIVSIFIMAFAVHPVYEDLADELEDLVGYTIICSKTIERWYGNDEKDDSSNYCDHNRGIVFTDGTALICAVIVNKTNLG